MYVTEVLVRHLEKKTRKVNGLKKRKKERKELEREEK